jgi:hypothetical protein
VISWEMLGFRSTAESTSGSSLSDELSVGSRIGQNANEQELAADPPSDWNGILAGEVKSVLPKDEPLTPGILYVGVAGLAGSVLARNSEHHICAHGAISFLNKTRLQGTFCFV